MTLRLRCCRKSGYRARRLIHTSGVIGMACRASVQCGADNDILARISFTGSRRYAR
jgi:hypothetical protein